jgi:hypothetical protein
MPKSKHCHTLSPGDKTANKPVTVTCHPPPNGAVTVTLGGLSPVSNKRVTRQ